MNRCLCNLTNTILIVCVLATLADCATSKEAQTKLDQADSSQPDFFPILPWDPTLVWAQALIEGRKNGLESIADCNFNMAGFVLPKDLPECRKLGLGAIMLTTDPAFTNVQYIYDWTNLPDADIERRVKKMVDDSGANPAIKGYLITDEPGAGAFPALGKAVAAVKK